MAPTLADATPVRHQHHPVPIHGEDAALARLSSARDHSSGSGATLDPPNDQAVDDRGPHAEGVLRDDNLGGLPAKQGLYNPDEEKDACGVGFVCHIKGKPSHKIVSDARNLLCNMTHRGATGADSRDGDGAGVMVGIPHGFFVREGERDLGVKLPAEGEYAVGNIFFRKPTTPNWTRDPALKQQKATFTSIADKLGLRVLGWRHVPVDSTLLGPASFSREPIILQPFVVLKSHYGADTKEPQGGDLDERQFERQLYVLRKHATHTLKLESGFYICSLSTKNIVYKGQLSPVQVYAYYHDLNHVLFASHFCLVHSRFSTNTFPSWDRAQPMRWAAHNGEINTVRGNKNWMRAREGSMRSERFGDDLELLYPIIETGGSDSAAFDNVLELLIVNGVLKMHEAVMLMIPEANSTEMEPEKRAFYQWASCVMEPWDGPALFTFSDGRFCGANLDRNGLRPCRWITTTDDIIICASEVGTIAVEPEKVTRKGRLQPGKMLLVDTLEGRIVNDKELKMTTARRQPFANWVANELLRLPDIMAKERAKGHQLSVPLDESSVSTDPRLLAEGYSFEQLDLLLRPLVNEGKEALGSMGNDAPLACMATAPRLAYDYFRQLFAQVTNPPIDPIREAIVMSLDISLGNEGNLLEMSQAQASRLHLSSPVLSVEETEALKKLGAVYPAWQERTIDTTFAKDEGVAGYAAALERVCAEVTQAVEQGVRVVVLSDRALSADHVALSSAVATGGVHHHLVRTKQRSKIALIVESADAREVHHVCVLIGYGADAVCPWLCFEALLKIRREGLLKVDLTDEQVVKNYIAAVNNGILKVLSKMGISTLAGYRGSQIFEILGLHADVVEKCFVGTASRISGSDFNLLALDALELHERGYPSRETVLAPGLPETGEYHWRLNGEAHINDPASIASLQDAVREKNQKSYDAYSANARRQVRAVTLRGLLDFDFEQADPIPLEQVEPWHEIVKRCVTGAMSYGSISMEAHSSLAVAMNRIGGKSNTGEGGEDAARSEVMPNGDTMRSAIKQIASGRFGVTSAYLSDADELQIKMAQGAKPGEGGELPGHKVSKSIARTRHSTPGVGLISPPPHHDIYSIEDLKELIYDLKCANPRARISVKLVSEVGVGVVASGVAKARADHILISGHDGGTGASRWTGIKYAGLPWELGLAETHQTLVLNDLRGRVTLQTDGQIRTGRDVAIATLLGAEEWGFATVPLLSLGCVMMKKCLDVTTPVRTTNGIKTIAQLKVGDMLYDEANLPVAVTSVRDPQPTSHLVQIVFRDYASARSGPTRRDIAINVTHDHILSLTVAGWNPSIRTKATGTRGASKKTEGFVDDAAPGDPHVAAIENVSYGLEYATRCISGGPSAAFQREACDLHEEQTEVLWQLDQMGDVEMAEVSAEGDEAERDEAERDVDGRALTDQLLHEHRHRGDDGPKRDRLDLSADPSSTEMDRDDSGFQESVAGPAPKDVSDYETFEASRAPSPSSQQQQQQQQLGLLAPVPSQTSSASASYVPSRAPSSLRSLAEISSVGSDVVIAELDDTLAAYLADHRARLHERGKACGCGLVRKVGLWFGTGADGKNRMLLVKAMLESQHAHLVDPNIVFDGDIFETTAGEVASCDHRVACARNIKLYRCPPSLVVADTSQSADDLPLDPYFLTAWLGDGSKGTTIITSVDPEMLAYLQNLVDEANATRPSRAAPLAVTTRRKMRKGEYVRSIDTHATQDIYTHRIVSTVNAFSPGFWNPFVTGLRGCGVLNDKSSGIPDEYKVASREDRFNLLAGLIDTDGTYHKGHEYVLTQTGDDHKKIVDDFAEVAAGLGFTVGRSETQVRPPGSAKTFKDGAATHPNYIARLSGPVIEELQSYLRIPRKRCRPNVRYQDADLVSFTATQIRGNFQYRAIEVSGGLFQHETRTVLHNCHLNTCPVGIATQDPSLRAKFTGQPEHVINYFHYVAEELRTIMAKLGFRTINEMVGRADLLKVDEALRNPKTASLDLSALLKPAWKMRPGVATYKAVAQEHKLHLRLDNKFIMESELALTKGLPVRIDCEVVNTDRALGTTLSNHVSKRYGEDGLPKDTIHIVAKGSAGQSLGAFLAPGITFRLEGEANDYVGKGLSGGRIIVYPHESSTFKAEENIIVGNTCLYGATSGEAYIRGISAERFAVRNSGAVAVVEGCGDHGCEYMTGGRVVILGSTGRNFAAGMSGGIAYVFDAARDFRAKVNLEMVELDTVNDPHEIAALRGMIEDHKHHTGSTLAAGILRSFNQVLPRFVRVMPLDYKAVLEAEKVRAAASKKRNFTSAQPKLAPVEEAAAVPVENGKHVAEPAVGDLEDSMVDATAAKKRVQTLDKVRGFKTYKRLTEAYRNPRKRTQDWAEISTRLNDDELKVQSARCMDCGVPFCQSESGCPIGNVIPKWNDLVFKGQWRDALDRLLMTNNFPEFTGRVCPAPCEGACVLGINEAPVGIKSIEAAIIDKGWEMGWIKATPPSERTGKKVAVIGSGPAGLAAADQLNKAGHTVTVYDRNDRFGGLLMYGIPNMKLDKRVVQRRIDLMADEGVQFINNAHVGKTHDVHDIRAENDALIMATGATWPRDLKMKNRELGGIHFAMEFLQQNTKSLLDSNLDDDNYISAKGKNVIVIGGGDTGNDCIGTSIRHGATSVVNFELLPQPPSARASDNPWPQWPRVFRTDYGHAEVADRFGKDPREYSISTKEFVAGPDGRIAGVNTVRVAWEKDAIGQWKMSEVPDSKEFFPADLILLALGFLGPEDAAIKSLGLEQDGRSNIKTPQGKYATAIEGVFAAGDCRRGQSLIVHGINEGRQTAAEVDRFLVGDTRLPNAGSIKVRSFAPAARKSCQKVKPAVEVEAVAA